MSRHGGKTGDEDFVLVGKITKAHGIKGEVKVLAYTNHPEEFQHFPMVLLVDKAGNKYQEFVLSRGRGQGKLAILKLVDIDDRNAAESLAGLEVWVRKEHLTPLEPDEFYWHEMVGLSARTRDGKELGTVSALFSTAAHDVLVITGRGKEYLVPAKQEFIESIDHDAGTLKIAAVPGLLEIND